MDAKAIRELSDEDIKKRLEETQVELFNLNIRASTGALENPMRVRLLSRDVARFKTIMTEKANSVKQ